MNYDVSMKLGMSWDVRQHNDPVLRHCSTDVTRFDDKLKRTCETMRSTMAAMDGIGLAAPQVGIPKRFFVCGLRDAPSVVINPVLSDLSGEKLHSEGCLSITGLVCEVPRAEKCILRGYDLEQNSFEVHAEGLLACLFQHEVDHLDGLLLLDRMSTSARETAEAYLTSSLREARLRAT